MNSFNQITCLDTQVIFLALQRQINTCLIVGVIRLEQYTCTVLILFALLRDY